MGRNGVFSAHAEMFLEENVSLEFPNCFLCTCRDVSLIGTWSSSQSMFSLHMQRCFLLTNVKTALGIVFSAHAEMFLEQDASHIAWGCFLCTCRDVSQYCHFSIVFFLFSLHMQRCFQVRF